MWNRMKLWNDMEHEMKLTEMKNEVKWPMKKHFDTHMHAHTAGFLPVLQSSCTAARFSSRAGGWITGSFIEKETSAHVEKSVCNESEPITNSLQQAY